MKDSDKAKICIDFDVNNSALTYRLGKIVANGKFSPPSLFSSSFYLLDKGSRLYSFRVYSRPLTEEERFHNEWIDNERFGL